MTQQKTQGSDYCGLNSLSDSYKEFKSEYPDSKTDRKMYSKIAFAFFKEALKHLLTGGEVRLPADLGVLKIVKRKRNLKNLKPDWKSTNELWERDSECKEKKQIVYYLNEHSGGFFYRFFWNRGSIKNVKMYGFKPVRAAQKSLAHSIIAQNKDYIG